MPLANPGNAHGELVMKAHNDAKTFILRDWNDQLTHLTILWVQ